MLLLWHCLLLILIIRENVNSVVRMSYHFERDDGISQGHSLRNEKIG
jgi:hypothetical protein